MRVLNDWSNTQAATGEYDRLPVGAYMCRILAAKIDTTTTGKERFLLEMDINEGPYKDHFTKQAALNPNASTSTWWPCTLSQLTETNDSKTNPFFKGLMSIIEQWNTHYRWEWKEQTLINLVLGIVFREEEYLNNYGEIRRNVKPFRPVSPEAFKLGVKLPEPRLLDTQRRTPPHQSSHTYPGSPQSYEDELPF